MRRLKKRQEKYIGNILYRLCACGCSQYFIAHKNHGRETRFISGHNTIRKYPKPIANHHYCECGCGVLISSNRKFFKGHSSKKHCCTKKQEEARRKLGLSQKGVVRSQAFKDNVSKTQKGHFTSSETRRKIGAANKGRIMSEEVRRKNSEWHKGRPSPNKGVPRLECTGENHWNWQGGIYTPYSKDWNRWTKERIRERDGNICQICFASHFITKLDVHHIDYDKKNCSEDNLIALCHSCHTRTSHKKDRNAWQSIFASQ
jgi:ribosomal protein L35